jgi:hypothetical protein
MPRLLRTRDCRSDSHENDGGVHQRGSQRGLREARFHVRKLDRECASDRDLCNYDPVCKRLDLDCLLKENARRRGFHGYGAGAHRVDSQCDHRAL